VTDPARAELGLTLSQAGFFLGLRGDTANARAYLEQAHSIFARAADSAGISEVENSQGVLAHARGDLAAAQRHFLTAVDIKRRRHDRSLGDALGNLGVVYDDLRRSEAAEQTYREALAELEPRFGPEHETVTSLWNNLALLLNRTGRAVQAESIYRRALAIDERKLGKDHPNVGRTLVNLSLLRCSHGDASAGLPMAQRALAILSKESPADGWQLAAARNVMGVCLTTAKRYPEAEIAFTQALHTLEKALGPAHWRTDSTRARLRRMYVAWGKPERAAELEHQR